MQTGNEESTARELKRCGVHVRVRVRVQGCEHTGVAEATTAALVIGKPLLDPRDRKDLFDHR
jgi:hypothetical protein